MTDSPKDSISTNVIPLNLKDEMRSSYLNYAMSVIVGRALPDVRDGLKPVHRRILFAMHDLKNAWNQSYKKSARVVGDVIGKYHPHGDQAVYDALVRMAQDFSMRAMLVDGQGNFGSVDGDPPAAMRYTEVRMARLTQELLANIDKNTVDFQPNYDDSLKEPVVLPAAFPNLLVNGSNGIAVGMATNIPPHNIVEVIDSTITLIRNPNTTLDELMKIMPGPDFPTGAIIRGHAGIYKAYSEGRGILTVRALSKIEETNKSGRERIIVTQLPFQVNKARLLKNISELVKDKKIEGISGLRDESDRHGMRMVIDIKRDAVAQVILNHLHKMTTLQSTFGIIFLAIVNGRPKMMGLKELLTQFLKFREEVVYRRSCFERDKCQAREHILQGLKIAIDNIDEVVSLIRGSANPKEAAKSLEKKFELSEIQAKEILAMRLQRLTGLERDKVISEIELLKAEIKRLVAIIENRSLLQDLIIKELERIKNDYPSNRRTQIVEDETDFEIEDLIAEEDMVVTVSRLGYIKRTPLTEYKSQHRGGRGLAGMETKGDDFVAKLFVASTHSHVLFFSDKGKAYLKKVYQVPSMNRTSRGKAIVNFVGMEAGEKVAAVLPVKNFEDGRYILTATRKGYVKKTDIMAYSNIRVNGIIGVIVGDDDQLIGAETVDEDDYIVLGTMNGRAIRFKQSDARAMGRSSHGVRGIEIRRAGGDDKLVGMAVFKSPIETSGEILTVCENGYGKRTKVENYREQHRGGRGIFTIKMNKRNGKVIDVLSVSSDDHLMIITNKGKIIRMAAQSISSLGRNTMGVRLIRLAENEKVVAVECLADKESSDEEINKPPPPSIIPEPDNTSDLETTEDDD